MLEHEWKDKNMASHLGNSIVMYVCVTLMRLYTVFCLILYIISKRPRRRWWAHSEPPPTSRGTRNHRVKVMSAST